MTCSTPPIAGRGQPKALAALCYVEHINDLGALSGMVERIAEKHDRDLFLSVA
ncbi:hypothetical protein PY793_12405 [Acetobacter fabarum]